MDTVKDIETDDDDQPLSVKIGTIFTIALGGIYAVWIFVAIVR